MNNKSLRNKSIPPVTLVSGGKRIGSRAVLFILGAIAVLAAGAFGINKLIVHSGGAVPAKEQITELKQQLEKLSSERQILTESSNSADSKLNIELSTQKQLASQVQTLTEENNKLKEDLAFFNNLIPASSAPQGVRIGGFKADSSDHAHLKYRVLVMQGGKGVRDFVGELQLVATVNQAGKNVTLTFPDSKEGDAGKLKLSFKYYQRMEGTLSLPDGSSIKTLQARILDNGKVRAEQSINL